MLNQDNIKLTSGQQTALDSMLSGKNTFFTGSAGTGKSTVVEEFILRTDKNILLTAFTGIAAINIGGATINRTFGLGKELCPLERHGVKVPDTIAECDAILIDEISMVRVDLFEYIVAVLTREEKNGHHIQLICTGDFFQLPPVIPEKERQVLDNFPQYQDKSYAFESDSWEKMNFVTIILDEVVRQSDTAFSHALDLVKVGDKAGLEWINEHAGTAKRSSNEPPVVLCSVNAVARKINQKAIEKLHFEKRHTFEMDVSGTVESSEIVTDKYLTLCDGARVMAVINAADGSYQNGSIGTVSGFVYDEDDELGVLVHFDNENEVLIKRHTWQVEEYVSKEVINDDGKKEKVFKKKTIGEYSQIPLKLAYAITIHKSQGKTYDSVEYNAGRGCFSNGQLYVALSRVKDVSKLYITDGIIKDTDLITSPAVVNFYNHIKITTKVEKLEKYCKSKKGDVKQGAKRPDKELTKMVRVPQWAALKVKEIFHSDLSHDQISTILETLEQVLNDKIKQNYHDM